jgi:hypothetical protein
VRGFEGDRGGVKDVDVDVDVDMDGEGEFEDAMEEL